MILTKNDKCPKGKIKPTSDKCKKCKEYLEDAIFEAYDYDGVYCKKAMTKAERICFDV